MVEAQGDIGFIDLQDNNTVQVEVYDKTWSDPDLRDSQSLDDAAEYKFETNTNHNENLTYYTSAARRAESPEQRRHSG